MQSAAVQRARKAGVRRRFAPHQLRHAHAVEMAREGVPLIVIQRQLGHTNLGITSIYLEGIDSTEIVDTVHAPPRPSGPGPQLVARLKAARPAAVKPAPRCRSSSDSGESGEGAGARDCSSAQKARSYVK